MIALEKIRRILVVQTAFLGDVILTIPLVKALQDRFPERDIDFLTIPASKNLLETLPYLRYLWIYDKHGQDGGILKLVQWMKKLREQAYDLAIVPHRSLRSALLVRGAGIPWRIGFDTSAGAILFTHRVKYQKNLHEIDRNLSLLKPLGMDTSERILPEIFFTEEDERRVRDWLSENDRLGKNELISLAPGSVWATKRWLPEYYAALADKLYQAGYSVVLIGSEADIPIIRQVQNQARHPLLSAAGQFTLRQSAFLIQQSRLLVSNDSAPLHLAVAVRTPVVAIFGPTVPAFGFYPVGEFDRVVELTGLSCRPCSIHGGQKCPIKTFDCMRGISPETVFQQVLEVLHEANIHQSATAGKGQNSNSG